MKDFLDSDLEGFDLFIAFLNAIGPDLGTPCLSDVDCGTKSR